jgi:iron(III) transport system substrate-binding protein
MLIARSRETKLASAWLRGLRARTTRIRLAKRCQCVGRILHARRTLIDPLPMKDPMRHFAPLAAVLCILLASCSRTNAEAPAAAEGSGESASTAVAESAEGEAVAAEDTERVLVVYSGRSEALVGDLFAKFEAEYNVDVRVNYAGSSELAATVIEEGANSPADVFFSQDSSTLGMLDQRDVFATLPTEVQELVPAAFRSRSGSWVGVSGRARVLTYASDRVQADALPRDVDALTTAAWQGRVGWAPTNSSFQSFLTAMVEQKGPEVTSTWVRAMLANEPRTYPSNTPGVVALCAGEIDVMLTNHYYMNRVLEEQGDSCQLANHYFRDGSSASLVNVTGAGVLATSTRSTLAAEFITFLLGEEAQKHFALENGEFPVVSSAPTPPGLPSIAELNPPDIDLSSLGNMESAVRILQGAGAL